MYDEYEYEYDDGACACVSVRVSVCDAMYAYEYDDSEASCSHQVYQVYHQRGRGRGSKQLAQAQFRRLGEKQLAQALQPPRGRAQWLYECLKGVFLSSICVLGHTRKSSLEDYEDFGQGLVLGKVSVSGKSQSRARSIFSSWSPTEETNKQTKIREREREREREICLQQVHGGPLPDDEHPSAT